MYRNAVEYKGVWLAPGSESMKLYQEKKFKQLDELLADCEKRKRKLEGK